MFVTPPLSAADVVQTDRWDHGPLELIFIDFPASFRAQNAETWIRYLYWNTNFCGGFVRPGCKEILETIPGIKGMKNPNVMLVPRVRGATELHTMLLSVLPEAVAAEHGLAKRPATFHLMPMDRDGMPNPSAFARRVEEAFETFIWKRVASRRMRAKDFAADASLRILCGDSRFWMNRLYRLAMARAEALPRVRESTEERVCRLKWTREFRTKLRGELRDLIEVRPPPICADLWDYEDPEDCEDVVDGLISGDGVLDSIEPVLEVLRSDRVHEDFSDRHSWIKEDFERSFYSKRSRVTVSLIETADAAPAWSASTPYAFDDLILRDVLAMFRPRDRHIVLAIRSGKTVTEIAAELGHRGHAAVSRRLASIKTRLAKFLGAN